MTLAHLQAEVERLRALLEDHGIDPDYDPDAARPPLYGPPTIAQMGMAYLVKTTAQRMARQTLYDSPFMRLLERNRK